ncbi:hypothetical protein [uncultured Croceitalea sp.]|uniref:hypothetical protein n=1 Tax=uncultured Croceitalea sp. TaxID=1798908 RepID=UPI0033064077
MKKALLFLLTLASFLDASAQTDFKVENNQWTVGILLPGVTYEGGIAENSTLTAELTFGFQYRESDFFEDGFGLYPIGRLQYRNYLNFDRRLRKGKRIDGNSGNYLAPTVAFQDGNAVVGDLDTETVFAFGVVYGIQRTAPKGFQFRLEAGPAYFKDDFESGFGLLLAAKIGWVLKSGRKNK